MTPEKLHLALNHIPFLGAGFALIPLLLGVLQRNRTAIAAGLLIGALSGWVTPLVMSTGEEAYERYEDRTEGIKLDPEAEVWLEIHEERGHTWSKLMYANAVVSTACLGLIFWKPKWMRGAALFTALLCAVTLAAGIWIADSGGTIRRVDFRSENVPASIERESHHSHSDDD